MAGFTEDDRVVLDHGTGAGLSRELLQLVLDELGEVSIGELEDSVTLTLDGNRIAMTTDSFVVDPAFFGNGDIGKIAVCGTVNDLAVVGAEPKYLTLALIIEAGLPMDRLRRVIASVRDTAREAGVVVAAGDTKVVRTGEADGIYVNTTGVGLLARPALRMADVQPGDQIVLSANLGDHTVHLLSVREGLGFETRVLSDCAPLNGMIGDLLASTGPGDVRSMRDVTRGGFAGVLHEYATALNRTLLVEESALPLAFETRMAMDMLGINPIHAANEGCLCLFVAPAAVDRVLEVLRAHPYGQRATVVGEVGPDAGPSVVMVDADGAHTRIEELRGAELPRLC